MADALSMSMGGRVASIYKHSTKQRRFTTVVNDIENKRLGFIKRQLEYDRVCEENKLNRTNEKMITANDEMKAFQVALLRRIAMVKKENKVTGDNRPLINLGKYGGASVEYIKAESEKYKRIRDPQKRRMIKAKIFLEQGKRDGRIKNFEPKAVGDMAENILKLHKAELPDATKLESNYSDIANLNDVSEADDNFYEQFEHESKHKSKEEDMKRSTYPPTDSKRLILPPLQVKRTLNPNSNYYRKISADYHKREAMKRAMHKPLSSPLHQRRSLLEDIIEEGDAKRKIKSFVETGGSKMQGRLSNHQMSSFPVTSLAHFSAKPSNNEPQKSKKRSPSLYEWDYSKSVGPVTVGKHLNDSQKFWRPQESIASKKVHVFALPSIK